MPQCLNCAIKKTELDNQEGDAEQCAKGRKAGFGVMVVLKNAVVKVLEMNRNDRHCGLRMSRCVVRLHKRASRGGREAWRLGGREGG